MDRCKFYDCTINGVPLATFGGASLLGYTIGETPVDASTFQGLNRSNWLLLSNVYGLREIRLTIVFEAPDLRQAKLNRSALNSVLFEKAELFIPDDGFRYSVLCTSTGAETLIGQGSRTAQIKSEYTFKGIRHDAMQTITLLANGSFYCLSTMPFTDCKLTATAGVARTNYSIGGAVFKNIKKNDVVVFDGINGKITVNGANYAANVTWTDFPSLTPGWNTITCPDAVTVEYEPTYI